MINTDYLAEMHYAKYSPEYETEQGLEEQRQKIREKAETVLKHAIKQALWTLDETELKLLAEDRQYISEWIFDELGEYE